MMIWAYLFVGLSGEVNLEEFLLRQMIVHKWLRAICCLECRCKDSISISSLISARCIEWHKIVISYTHGMLLGTFNYLWVSCLLCADDVKVRIKAALRITMMCCCSKWVKRSLFNVKGRLAYAGIVKFELIWHYFIQNGVNLDSCFNFYFVVIIFSYSPCFLILLLFFIEVL